MVAGHTAPNERMMGHAGAIRQINEPSAKEKEDALEKAGAVIARHTGEIGKHMKRLLESRNLI